MFWTIGMRRDHIRSILIHEHVTGGGLAGEAIPDSLAREGSAMRRALVQEFSAVGDMRVACTLDRRFAEEESECEYCNITCLARYDSLLELSRKFEYTLVIAPETAGVLAEIVEALALSSTRLLVSSPASIRACGDKLVLAGIWNAAGLPHPRSEPWDGERAPAFPVVIKPIDGAGGLETRLLRDAADFSRFQEGRMHWGADSQGVRGPRMIVQPFVEGAAMSASFLVDAFGVPHSVCHARQNIAWDSGSFSYRGGTVPVIAPENAAPLLEKAVRAVEGLAGWVGVDYLWNDATGAITLIELNPRVTTSITGVLEISPPGCLANAWLGLLGGERSWFDVLRSSLLQSAPIDFLADGT